jgi:transposase
VLLQLTHVSADGAEWIHDVVAARAPQAVLRLGAFHVVAWAIEALDQVRRAMVNRLRAGGHDDEAAALKGSRWALLKNPPKFTGNQRTTLAGIAKANGGLYRAPTCSKSSCGRSSPATTRRRPAPCWAAGSPGPSGADANRSSSSRKRSNATGR